MDLARLRYDSVSPWDKTLSIAKEIPEYVSAFLRAKGN
jgi:hypothetical protein